MTDDLRNHSIVVVSHHVVNRTTLPAIGGGEISRSVIEWAHGRGYGIYQLPTPAFYFEPLTDESTARFASAETRVSNRLALGFVASQLRVYLDNGYRLIGAVFLEQTKDDPRERIWAEDFLAVTAEAAIDIPRLWQLPNDPALAFDEDSSRFQFAVDSISS